MARKQELRVVISGDSTSLTHAFQKAGRSAGEFEGKIQGTVSRVGSAMRSLSVGAIAGAGLGFSALVKAGVDYEKQMARVRGVTNATGKQMQSLGTLAKQLGADTKFSAGEAAQAMYELGSAGFKVNDMAKVLPATLSLAAASGIELRDAAEIASNALNGFGLSGDKMGHVADVLATTVNRTSTEMGDLQGSLKFIGPIARLTGQSFETMLAAVGELGDAGIKGEQAGTTLRAGLIRLSKPTKMVSEGFKELHLKVTDLYGPNGLKPLTQIIPILEDGLKGVDASTRNAALAQIFGTEAATGWAAIILKGSKALRDNTRANRESEGAAEHAAKIMDSTVAGAWENLTGSIETVGITLFEHFQKPLRSALLSAAHSVNSITDLFAKVAGVKPPSLSMRRDIAGNTALRRDAQETASIIQDQSDTMFGRMGDAVADAIKGIDWKSIGDTMADGLKAAFQASGRIPGAVEKGMSAALSHVNGRKLLSGLLRVVAEAIDALFSPSFWKENFASIFATVTIAIPVAKIFRIPGAPALYRWISKPFFETIGKFGKWLVDAFAKVGKTAVSAFLDELANLAPKTAHVLRSIVTGAGGWLGGLPGKFRSVAARAIDALVGVFGKAAGIVAGAVGRLAGQIIKALGGLAGDFFRGGWDVAKSILNGIVRGIGKGMGAVGGAIRKGLKALTFGAIGEGIGRSLRDSGGAGEGGLKGARSSLSPFAAIGSRFGLHVSSGRRPGAITSSGNVSYHSTGEAIDEAGSAPDMLRYFRYMKERFGGQLAELIHTPGGAGIKDGRPYRYGGQVAADHYDHVHVAFDSGRPGVGDGLGRFTATSYGPPWGGIQGSGVTATGVNLHRSPHVYGIAVDPSVIPLGTRVRVQPNPFGYGGTFRAFDTGGAIKGNRIDFYDWRGRAAQNRWGSRTVSVSTDEHRGGGDRSSRSSLDAQLNRNLDRLDSLRSHLANVPRTKAHAHERNVIQGQIRSLVADNRRLRGDIRDLPSPRDRQADQERAGSRLVNRIARPFAKAISRATGVARGLATQIEDADTIYGQVQRRQEQTDEDLGTAGGRTHRISELAELKKLKLAQLGRERKRAAALKRAITRSEKQLKALHKARAKARGAKRAKMNERIKAFDDRLVDLKAEYKALGFAIKDTELDIGDLEKEAKDVAATPDTEAEAPAEVAAPTVTERVQDLIDLVNLRERAGVIDAATAAAQRVAIISAGIQGQFGATTDREQLQLMGDLRDAQQQNAEAVSDLAAAVADLKKSIDAQLAFANGVSAITSMEAVRALADMMSKQMGYTAATRAVLPGSGQLSRL